MAQAQIRFSNDLQTYLRGFGFENVSWSPIRREITCTLCDKFVIVVKERQRRIKIIFKKGHQSLQLPFGIFETHCYC